MEQAQEEKKPGKDMTPGELRGGKVASVSGSGMGLGSKGGRALTDIYFITPLCLLLFKRVQLVVPRLNEGCCAHCSGHMLVILGTLS